MDLPPTITCTSTPLALKSKPLPATPSPPLISPSPTPYSVRVWPGLDGENVKPLLANVVKRLISSWVWEMKFCATARPLPELSAERIDSRRCTTLIATGALGVPLLFTTRL